MLTKAIIIKKQNTNEYDQLITCYTKELGKITAIAKSILKPGSVQAMHLDVLNLVEFDLVDGRAMPIITGAQGENFYARMKNFLPALAAGYFLAEVLDKMFFEEEKDVELWNFAADFLNRLEAEPERATAILRSGQAPLLKLLGYFPMLEKCVFCSAEMKNTDRLALSLEMGGLLCQNCFLRGFRGVFLKKEDWAALISAPFTNDGASNKGRSVLDGLFEYTFDIRFQSLDFFYQVVR